VQRPRAKEGGREEEEKRSGISVGSSDRLHSNKHSSNAPALMGAVPMHIYAYA